MRKFILLAVVIALLASTGVVNAAPPPDGPPGLEKAIAAQMKHNPQLLTTPGVVGTAVGLGADGTVVVKVFTEKPGVANLPAVLDGVPVVVQVTGKLMALKGKPTQNTPPVVTITSPVNNDHFDSGASIHFEGTAYDNEEGNLSDKLVWTSSIDGSLYMGANFDKVLSDGTHTITAKATDSRRKTGSASITVTVGGTSGQKKTTDIWDRPVPIGISTGNYQDVSAGTIACRVVKVVDGISKVYALSNTHVYAPNDISGYSELGDFVTQPGLIDVAGYTYSDSLKLGTLTAYKPIDGYGINDIDAAIALTDTNKLGNSTPIEIGGYGTPNKVTAAAAIGMAVQKFGRTTLLTKGNITGINASVIVGYGPNWYAIFYGQIIVETNTAFILPGDSGSLMVTNDLDGHCHPVGLLFAGNNTGTYAIANPINLVLSYFGVTIDGKE